MHSRKVNREHMVKCKDSCKNKYNCKSRNRSKDNPRNKYKHRCLSKVGSRRTKDELSGKDLQLNIFTSNIHKADPPIPSPQVNYPLRNRRTTS
jgi:hypothetical protein